MPKYLYILSLSNLLKFTSFGLGELVENKLVDKKSFLKKTKIKMLGQVKIG